MKIRQVDPTVADVASAATFFSAMTQIWDLSDVVVLDAFARNGSLTVTNYASKCKEFDCWELSPDHRSALLDAGSRTVRIGCSYRQIDREHETYGCVVIDTPQGMHADHTGTPHAEHFDFLGMIGQLVDQTALVALYVNKKPYNRDVLGSFGYDEYAEYDFKTWMEKREEFFGKTIVTEDEALAAYRKLLLKAGFLTKSVLVTPSHSDVPGLPPYAFRAALEIERL